MSFIKNNLPIVLVYLACSFVACNCAPALNTDALSAQKLAIDASAGPLAKIVNHQATGEVVENQGGEEVSPITEDDSAEETEEADLIDEEDEDLDDDDIWNPNWGEGDDQDEFDENEEEMEEDDDDWIAEVDDDWENDFDYIDNKETADNSE